MSHLRECVALPLPLFQNIVLARDLSRNAANFSRRAFPHKLELEGRGPKNFSRLRPQNPPPPLNTRYLDSPLGLLQFLFEEYIDKEIDFTFWNEISEYHFILFVKYYDFVSSNSPMLL